MEKHELRAARSEMSDILLIWHVEEALDKLPSAGCRESFRQLMARYSTIMTKSEKKRMDEYFKKKDFQAKVRDALKKYYHNSKCEYLSAERLFKAAQKVGDFEVFNISTATGFMKDFIGGICKKKRKRALIKGKRTWVYKLEF